MSSTLPARNKARATSVNALADAMAESSMVLVS
jgi:hypothetical protein